MKRSKVTTAKSLINILYDVLVEVATLKNAPTAAAAVAFILAVTGVGIPAATLTGAVVAIGIAAAFVVKTFFTHPPSA